MGETPFKIAFVDVKYTKEIVLPQDFLQQLPQTVILFASIQFHNQLGKVKAQLEQAGKTVILVRPKHSWQEGQLLGCGIDDWSAQEFDAFVYIGDGDFHSTALLFNNDKNVFQYDPKKGESRTLTPDYIKNKRNHRKAALSTFAMSRRIGVVMTTKYGQNRMDVAKKLEEKYPDKEFYYLLDDDISFSRLEDWPFIECFVNTACPRIMDDHDKFPKPVTNLQDVLGEEW